jgi:hypothetical protein
MKLFDEAKHKIIISKEPSYEKTNGSVAFRQLAERMSR